MVSHLFYVVPYCCFAMRLHGAPCPTLKTRACLRGKMPFTICSVVKELKAPGVQRPVSFCKYVAAPSVPLNGHVVLGPA